MNRDAKKNDATKALLDERRKELFQPVDTPSALTRKTGDLDARVGIVGDEDGVHEHPLREAAPCLPGAGERVLVASLEDGPGGRGGRNET